MVSDLPEIGQYAKGLRSVEISAHDLASHGEVLFVNLMLSLGQVAEDDVLIAIREITLDLQLLFRPPQNVPLNEIPQLIKTLPGGLFLDIGRIRVPTLDDGFAKHVLEVVQLTKEAWLNKVEETPKLL